MNKPGLIHLDRHERETIETPLLLLPGGSIGVREQGSRRMKLLR